MWQFDASLLMWDWHLSFTWAPEAFRDRWGPQDPTWPMQLDVGLDQRPEGEARLGCSSDMRPLGGGLASFKLVCSGVQLQSSAP